MITPITKKIYIGEKGDVTENNIDWLFHNRNIEIDCVLDLTDIPNEKEADLCNTSGVEYIKIPVPSKKQFKQPLAKAATVLEKLVKQYDHIIVHCDAGIDRAPFVVALYLSNVAHLSLGQAYNIVKANRKETVEHYEWLL